MARSSVRKNPRRSIGRKPTAQLTGVEFVTRHDDLPFREGDGVSSEVDDAHRDRSRGRTREKSGLCRSRSASRRLQKRARTCGASATPSGKARERTPGRPLALPTRAMPSLGLRDPCTRRAEAERRPGRLPGQRHPASVATLVVMIGPFPCRVLQILRRDVGDLGQSEFFTLIHVRGARQREHQQARGARAFQAEARSGAGGCPRSAATTEVSVPEGQRVATEVAHDVVVRQHPRRGCSHFSGFAKRLVDHLCRCRRPRVSAGSRS